MKKKQLKKIIVWLDNFIRMNEKHMQIQDNALIRKDEEIIIKDTIISEQSKTIEDFKKYWIKRDLQLEETQEALSRSRNFVRIIQSDKRRSIKDMAKDLYDLYYNNISVDLRRSWEDLVEWEQEHWMWHLVEILSWEKLWRW